MVALTIKAFRGATPRSDDRLLQPNQASIAKNVRLVSGRIDPLPLPSLVHTSLLSRIQSMFRYRFTRDGVSTDNWLTWNADVDFVPSLLAQDSIGRFYYSGDGEPRMSTYADAISGVGPYPAASFVLGVFAPTVKPTVAVVGGSGATETRNYVYTFVTKYGEESGPSPAETLSGFVNGSWNSSAMQVAPINSGTITGAVKDTPSPGYVEVTLSSVFGLEQYEYLTVSGVVGMTSLNAKHRIVSVDRTLNKIVVALLTAQNYTSGGAFIRNANHNTSSMVKRIYRSAGTNAGFQFVAEIPVAQTTYNDTILTTALGESLPTALSLTPPKNMTCMTTMPNGCLVGLSNNELCFSEPYLPYQWPLANRYTFTGTGVALHASGNSVIVLTDTYPIIFTGTDPAGMVPAVMQSYAPCLSKRGVASASGGCLFPSFDGLWIAAPGRLENLTRSLYSNTEWALLNPAGFISEFHNGQYYARFTLADGVTTRILSLDIVENPGVVEIDEWADDIYRNDLDGNLYLAQGNLVYQLGVADVPTYFSEWKSAILQLAKPTNFAVAQVHADFSAIVAVDESDAVSNAALLSDPYGQFGAINGDSIHDFGINDCGLVPTVVTAEKVVNFTLYADDAVVLTKNVRNSTPFRLPAGYRSDAFNIGLSTSIPVYSASMAESTAELGTTS